MHSPLIEHHWDGEIAKANKALIASAPELLEALEAMVSEFDDNFSEGSTAWDALRKAKEAIKKARGL
jgi:hypothetical protein